jgi:hypothetical protein
MRGVEGHWARIDTPGGEEMLGCRTRRTAIGTALAPLASLVAVALAPAAAHAAAWLKPVPLNTATGAGGLSVAMDAGGNTLAAWNTDPLGVTPAAIEAAHHTVGVNGFTPLADFSDDTADANTTPLVVLNGAGQGLAIWVHKKPMSTSQEIELRTVSSGGVVGSAQHFGSGMNVTSPAAAIDAGGDAVVAWQQDGSAQAITRQGAGGTFNGPVTLDLLAPDAPSVAIDGGGNAIAVWRTGFGTGGIGAGRHPAGGTWTTTAAISNAGGHVYTEPHVAANPNGTAVVGFQDTSGSGTAVSVESGTVSALSAGTLQTLSGSGVNHGPSVTIDDAGNAAVGWGTGSAAQISLGPGRVFPPPAGVQSIPASGLGSFALNGDGGGDLVASWSLFDTTVMQNVARAAVKPRGSASFGAAQTISDTTTYSSNPVIALDQGGDAVAGIQLGSTPAGVAAAIFDNTPPKLSAPTGPAIVAKGTAASFSATATDAFSAFSLAWSFGDGTATAAGGTVSHTYATAGTFTVKVTATDTAGNAASATRTITVTGSGPPPPPPPPPKVCKVPKLKGKTLSQARTLLTRAGCTLGKVSKPKARKHQRLRKLVVSRTAPGAGAVRRLGTKVAVTLVQVPKPKPKHHK